MKKEKPKMPYILGEPEGLGRGGSEEIIEEEKRLSGGVRQKGTSEDIISNESDPLQRLIEQEEGVHNIDGIESTPGNGGGTEGEDNDVDGDEADEDEKTFEEATSPTQEQTDDSTRSEYSDTQSGSLLNTATQDKLIRPRGVGERPSQKPRYKDKIGRATLRGQNPST